MRPQLSNWTLEQKQQVSQAVEQGIIRYLDSRRLLVDEFVENNYSFNKAWNLNKKAFGLDMLKVPANILWTPPYFLLNGTGRLLTKAGKKKLGAQLTSLPAGFSTDVEKEVSWRIHTQLLELPYQQQDRVFTDNRLLAMILEDESLLALFDDSLNALAALVNDKQGKEKLADNLTAYVDSRKAAAELSAAMISMATGYVANKSINFGAMGLGNALAASIAHSAAASNFILGNTLGSLYYSVFSATASKTTLVLSTGGVAIVLGMVSSYTGVLTDPLQKSLGWHQKKLHKLIDGLELQFLSDSSESIQFKDGYVARVLDIADALMTLTLK